MRVNGSRKLTSCRQGGFQRRSQHLLKSGGCVVVASSCQEGAGAASAVGQTSAVHGVARTRVEHPRRGSRGRCVSDHREQLVAWLQDVPPWPGRRASCRRWSDWPCDGSARGSCRRKSGSRSPTFATPGLSIRAIAQRLRRAPSTISRELRRNAAGDGGYRPFEAHRRAATRRARGHRRRIDTDAELRQLVADAVGPAVESAADQPATAGQVSRRGQAMWLCHESIYQAIYQPGSALLRPSRLAPHRRSPLRTGRDHRRAQQHTERRRPRFQHPMLTIHERPFPPEDRSQAGHWEGDLIIGKDQASAIGTLVERKTRIVRLLHLPQPRRRRLARCPDRTDGGSAARPADGRSPGTREPKWPAT